jgi:D-alanyl-D-alanine carboxypeptidase (penicillin-binding protein 5/6)
MFLVTFALVIAYDPIAGHMREHRVIENAGGFFSEAMDGFGRSSKKLASFFSGRGDAEEAEEAEEAAEDESGFLIASERNPEFSNASLYSSSALLANFDTGRVLLAKNAGLRVYPASLTKIMTALLAIERLPELPERLTLDADIFPALYAANSSMAGFLPGESVAAVDLVYGALLQSGGECGVALARAIAGSEEAFADMMNARARELGMTDTHFANATGLHDGEHYSTARDLSKLLFKALGNERFREIFTAPEHTTAPTSHRPDGVYLESSAFSGSGPRGFDGGRIIGGKTGYTSQAGRCLASLAEKNGSLYIFVSLGNGVEANGSAYNFEDALNVYENGIL